MTRSPRSARRLALAAAVAAVAALPAPASAATWRPVKGVRLTVGVQLAVARQGARAWLATTAWPSGAPAPQLVAASFPIVRGGLGAGRVTRRTWPGGYADPIFTAGTLVYGTPGAHLGASALLGNGGLGPVRDLSATAIADYASAAVTIGGRLVWASAQNGGTLRVGSFATGGVDQSALVTGWVWNGYVALGVDRAKRLWLAWYDQPGTVGQATGPSRLRMQRLDPARLTPLGAVQTAPVDALPERPRLACAATCRALVTTTGQKVVAWAPGDRKASAIAPRGSAAIAIGVDRRGRLLTATLRKGRIVIARNGVPGTPARTIATRPDPYQGPPNAGTFAGGGLVMAVLVVRGQYTGIDVGYIPLP